MVGACALPAHVPLHKVTLVAVTIGPNLDSFPLRGSAEEGSFVGGSVGPCYHPCSSAHICPLSLQHCSVRECECTLPFYLVLHPLTLVDNTIGPCVGAFTLLVPFFPLTFISVTVGPSHHALPFYLPLTISLSDVYSSIVIVGCLYHLGA